MCSSGDEELSFGSFAQAPPGVDDPQERTLKLSYGMDTRAFEPWFECEATQRFNDYLEGYIHGMRTEVQVFKGAYPSRVNVSALELSGKYTD